MGILVVVAQGHDAEAARVAACWRKQQFTVLLRAFEHAKLLEREAGVHVAWLAHLVLLIKKIHGLVRTDVAEAFWFAAAGLARSAPADDALSSGTKTLEQDVAVLAWKVKPLRLLRRVGAEIHLLPVINVKKLERLDERGLADVVLPDNLQRARQFDLRVFVRAGLDEDEALRAGGHGYSFAAAGTGTL